MDGAAEASGSRASLPLFRVAGIRIEIHYSWFLIFLLLLWSLSAGYLPGAFPGRDAASYWVAGLVATLLFFLSILLHELAHSLVALRHGIAIPSITLFVFGGVSRLGQEVDEPKTELKIAVAGPLMSFALALLFSGLGALARGPDGEPASLLAVVFGYIAAANGLLGLFNLLPGFPLDGGRVLRAFLWWRTGSFERATRAAANAGRAVGFLLMALGAVQIFFGGLVGGLWLVLIGLFLRGMAAANYERAMLARALEGVTVGDVMIRDPVTAPSGVTLRRLVDDYVLGHGYRGFPVVDDSRVRGVVSVVELRRAPRARWDELRVSDVMVPLADGLRVDPQTPLIETLGRIAGGGGRLLAMEGDELVGMLTKDGLNRFVELRKLVAPATGGGRAGTRSARS